MPELVEPENVTRLDSARHLLQCQRCSDRLRDYRFVVGALSQIEFIDIPETSRTPKVVPMSKNALLGRLNLGLVVLVLFTCSSFFALILRQTGTSKIGRASYNC